MKSLILTTLLKLTSSSEDASCNPTQIHVVGGLIPETSMTVSFMTESEACKSTVNFGTNADSLILTATNPSPPPPIYIKHNEIWRLYLPIYPSREHQEPHSQNDLFLPAPQLPHCHRVQFHNAENLSSQFRRLPDEIRCGWRPRTDQQF